MAKDRTYVLRTRGEAGEDVYTAGDRFGIEVYECGLRAGERVRLRKDLPVLDSSGAPTGQTHPKGEVWIVLSGAEADPSVLWFEQPDGEPHGWDDDETVFETFERVEQ